MNLRTKRVIALVSLFTAQAIFAACMFLTPIWKIYVDYSLTHFVKPLKLFFLPTWVSYPLAIFVVMFPVVLAGAALGAFARPFVRIKEPDLAAEHISDANAALESLKSASEYFQKLSLNIQSRIQEAEKLAEEINTLQEIRSEKAEGLQAKIRIVRGVTFPMLVISHISTLLLGIAGGVAANYLTDFLKSLSH